MLCIVNKSNKIIGCLKCFYLVSFKLVNIEKLMKTTSLYKSSKEYYRISSI
jgi:hypothetical protein